MRIRTYIMRGLLLLTIVIGIAIFGLQLALKERLVLGTAAQYTDMYEAPDFASAEEIAERIDSSALESRIRTLILHDSADALAALDGIKIAIQARTDRHPPTHGIWHRVIIRCDFREWTVRKLEISGLEYYDDARHPDAVARNRAVRQAIRQAIDELWSDSRSR